jgi:hypothetical protein
MTTALGQLASITGADSDTAVDRMESCQPIKSSKDKKKRRFRTPPQLHMLFTAHAVPHQQIKVTSLFIIQLFIFYMTITTDSATLAFNFCLSYLYGFTRVIVTRCGIGYDK